MLAEFVWAGVGSCEVLCAGMCKQLDAATL